MARSKVLGWWSRRRKKRRFEIIHRRPGLFHDEIPKNAVAKFYFEKKAPNVVAAIVRQLTACTLRCRSPDSFFIESILHLFMVLGQLALPRRRPFVAVLILTVW